MELYTLSLTTNTVDPVEARIEGDESTFQLPYTLPMESVFSLIFGELNTDDTKSKVFYLDDESDYIQINSQEEFDVALQICRKTGHRLHVVVSGNDIEKKKPLENEFVNDCQDTTVEEEKKTVDTSNLQKEVQTAPALSQQDVDISHTAQEEETTPQEHNQTILDMIKREVDNQVQQKMKDLVATMDNLETSMHEKIDKIAEQKASMMVQTDQAEKVMFPLSEKSFERQLLDAEFICENLVHATIRPNVKIQKYWVFRNEGSMTWNDQTKLMLLEESFTKDNILFHKTDQHDWGVNVKTVRLPSLKTGETGVVEAIHVTPDFKCCYTSVWRLFHSDKPFGSQVYCKLFVTDDMGTSVDSEKENSSNEESELNSFVDISVKPESSKEKEKFDVKQKSPGQQVHADDNISSMLSFNMSDISEATRFLPPSMTEQDQTFESCPKISVGESLTKSNPTSINLSYKSSNVDTVETTSIDVQVKTDDATENITQQNDSFSQLDKSATENKVIETSTETDVNKNEERESDSESISVVDENITETSEVENKQSDEDVDSDGLNSVEYDQYNQENNYESHDVSDFVVILPECFDVNHPLSAEKRGGKTNEKSESINSQTSTETSQTPTGSNNLPEYQSPSYNSSIPSEKKNNTNEIHLQSLGSNSGSQESERTSLSSTKFQKQKVVLGSVNSLTSKTQAETSNLDDAQSFQESVKEEHNSLSKQESSIDNDTVYEESSPPVYTNVLQKVKVCVKKDPMPIPHSVLDQDTAFEIPVQRTVEIPFEQGWRRNPIPLPRNVLETNPEVTRQTSTAIQHNLSTDNDESILESEISINMPKPNTTSLPSQPFAVERSREAENTVSEDFNNSETESDSDNGNEDSALFSTPPPSPQQERVVVAAVEVSPLDRIYEMGFHDIELNQDILEKCDGDVNRAVQALILRSLADNTLLPLDD